MSKYDNLEFFKFRKARIDHMCMECGSKISAGDYYYVSDLARRFARDIETKILCEKCYSEKAQ